MRQNFKQAGQTLIEVVVALALGTIVIVALVGLSARSTRNANFSKLNEIASKFGEEGLELVRLIRDQNGYVSTPAVCGACTTWDDLYNQAIGIGSDTVVLRPPTSTNQMNCNNFNTAHGTSGYWCLDDSGLNVSSTPGTDATFAPNTGGIQIKRNITVSDDVSQPSVQACNLSTSSSYSSNSDASLVLDFKSVKSVKVMVTWTDSIGTHEIDLQDCISKRT